VRIVDSCGGEDDAVGHRELVLETELGCEKRDSLAQLDDPSLAHQGDGLQCRRRTALPQDDLVHLVEAQGGDDELIGS
jgi:hypothetical protein